MPHPSPFPLRASALLRTLLPSLTLLASTSMMAQDLSPTNLRTEYLRDPLGIGVRAPRFSWTLEATDPAARDLAQSAWQIVVGTDQSAVASGTGSAWDSGKVDSTENAHNPYAGSALESSTQYFWAARVWDQAGAPSPWSTPARFVTGPLDEAAWAGARFIGTDLDIEPPTGWDPPDQTMPEPWFRKQFSLVEAPETAYIHVASVGYHELYVNGQRVGDTMFNPAVSDLNKRARYVTYDIAPYLNAGDNVIGLWLGVSWSIFPEFDTLDKPLVRAVANFTFPSEADLTLVTDHTWKTRPSHRRLLGIWFFHWYGGEEVDARANIPNWAETSLDDSAWDNASTFDIDLELSPQITEPNRIKDSVGIKQISALTGDRVRVQFNRQFAGIFEIDLRGGTEGEQVRFTVSERRTQEEEFGQHSWYIFDETGQGTFRNQFNYHGGEYLFIHGLGYMPDPEDIRAYMVSTDFEDAATLVTSDETLNAIFETTRWTFENMSLGGYVVDCPHRERMGYGGDAHSTTRTGALFYHTGAFYTKWMQDWRDVQTESGDLPYTAPTYWGGGGPSWSGFCLTLPWEVYRAYGDRRILDENYATIRAWLEFFSSQVNDGILQRFPVGTFKFLGDWVPPGGVPNDGASQEALFFNNCYAIYSFTLGARVATILGETEDAARWQQLADDMRIAVHAQFYDAVNANYVNGRQAYLALALMTELGSRREREENWATFEEEVLVEQMGHIDTGITGTWALYQMLTEQDRPDLAYTVTTQPGFPGYVHMLDQGVTVWWEKWEGQGSRMHSSYVAVGQWLLEGLAGLQTSETQPGFAAFTLKPDIASGLRSLALTKETVRGAISANWSYLGNDLVYEVTVPPGSTATIKLPTDDPNALFESGSPLSQAPGVSHVTAAGNAFTAQLASGTYRITSPLPSGANPFRNLEVTDLRKATFMGEVYDETYPWVQQPLLGWVYVYPLSDEAVWALDWDGRLGWTYLTPSYPWIYAPKHGGWLWQSPWDDGRWLWQDSTQAWLDLGPAL